MNKILFQLELNVDSLLGKKEFVVIPKHSTSANTFTDIEQKKVDKAIELLTDAIGRSFMRTLEKNYNEIVGNNR